MKKNTFAPGEIDFSEKKKAIDIYTAVNALYFPHYFVRPCKIDGKVMDEHYLVFTQNERGTNFNKAIFIPLNPEVLYTTPNNTAVHVANGMKVQETLGIKGDEYKEDTVCRVSGDFVSSIPKKSLREVGLRLWGDNLDMLSDISKKHPEFEGLSAAVEVLKKSKNMEKAEVLKNVEAALSLK